MALTRAKITNVDSSQNYFTDPMTVLRQGATSANVDVGFLFNRANGLVSNVALYWSESGNTFVTAFTSNTGVNNGNILVSSYTNLATGALSVTGTGSFTGNLTTGHILPSANITYDIGSPTLRFRTLYISGNTIDMGGAQITTDTTSGGFAFVPKPTSANPNPLGTVFSPTGAITTINTTGGVIAAGAINTSINNNQGTANFGNVKINSDVSSTSTTTGALVVTGGAGISGSLYVGAVTSSGTIIASTVNAATIGNAGATLTGTLSTATQNSVTTMTGLTAIGAGGTTTTIFGNLAVGGNLTVTGNSVSIGASTLSIADPIISLNTPSDLTPLTTITTADIGVKFHYYDTSDQHAFLGRAVDTGYLEWYSRGNDTANVFIGTVYGTIKSGAIVLANTASITAAGTIIAATVNAATIGNTGATLTGTLSTATQTNITSVGTLTSLSVSGTTISSGNIVASSGTNSTSTTTGALIVTGGTGISGNLYVGAVYTTTGLFWSGNGYPISTGGGGSAAGVTGQVQYNNAGSFGGTALYYFSGNSAHVTTGNIVADQIHAVSNGSGTNFRVGDDAWLGDINIANTVGLRGQQDATQGYIVFGNSNNTTYIGRSGTNPITVTGAFSVTGTITAATVNAATIGNSGATLTGTLSTAAQTNITSVGTLTSLAVSGAFTASSSTLTGTIIASTVNAATIGNISANHWGTGTYLTSLNASNLSSGTVPSAQISGSYTGITGVGALAAGSITTGFTAGYGDTVNPYASKTANYFLAAPNGSAAVPSFRAVVAADIPTLNQNTTGTAAGLSATLAVASGGTGVTTSTGTGSVVLNTSPTFVTPALGTPSSGTLTNCTFPTLNQNTTGSAATLTTARAINGVNFDGSAAITVTAAAGTLSGGTLNSGVTASSLTSLGNLTSLSVSGTSSRGGKALVTNYTGTIAPASPQQGDEWWYTTGNTLYKYIYDGTGYSWVNITPALFNASASATADTLALRDASANLYATNFIGIASSAKYADLAEVYVPDRHYEPGTVVVFGGDQEITTTNITHDTRVAGIVSTAPAYLMNSECIGLPVALTGRVPCLVKGPVTKGQLLVTSAQTGIAKAIDNSQFVPGCVIGKSLENITTDEIATIEVAVGRF